MPRILLLLPTTTYKATDFLDAARALGVEVVVASDRRQALEGETGGTTLQLDFEAEGLSRRLRALAARSSFDAVLGVDDETTVAAARIASALGLAHDPPEAAATARDKGAFRRLQWARGLPAPEFDLFPASVDPGQIARGRRYPCVLKPTSMSASRGVIRADDQDQLVAAVTRIRRLLADAAGPAKAADAQILIEDYLEGFELALEAYLFDGELLPLALFDKPDPLTGPHFAETLYISPARVPDEVREGARDAVERACRALGLSRGPVHAEVRFPPDAPPVVLEVAPRTIGGHCGRALRFAGGRSLAEVVIAGALGDRPPPPEERGSGVLMLPIPEAGTLCGVRGQAAARAVPGITGVEITIARGQTVVPLPEGDRYLGFVFAEGNAADDIERSLRSAWSRLRIEIEPA